MAEIETLGIVDEIQAIVSIKLQVVSYKWVSRNFSVSSNAAKRILEGFVEKYGDGSEVIYAISGWLKDNPSTYDIRLVCKNKLSDVKQEFDGNCSIQVYSVQASLPKDSATLWNHEFVQAEDLFKQPVTVDNCLRNNMFCGVSNSFVSRNVNGVPPSVPELSKSIPVRQPIAVPQPQQKIVNQSSPNVSIGIAKNVKTENNVKIELAPQLPFEKKKSLSDKNSSGAGSSLASMWGRASTKPKSKSPVEQAKDPLQIPAVSAEAQISSREALEDGSSDEDAQDFNIKRSGSNRKRRVMFDDSDEEDDFKDAVNLASPDPPMQSKHVPKTTSDASGMLLNFNEEKENSPKINEMVKEEVKTGRHSVEGLVDINIVKKPNKTSPVKELKENVRDNKSFGEEVAVLNKVKKPEPHVSEKLASPVLETDNKVKSELADGVPKRRKVLKTRIDERGREVTEVVWEGEEPETKPDNGPVKPAENNTVKPVENNTVNNATKRPPVVKKSPAAGPTNNGKAGNKKAPAKDPKQGSLMNFFKKA